MKEGVQVFGVVVGGILATAGVAALTLSGLGWFLNWSLGSGRLVGAVAERILILFVVGAGGLVAGIGTITWFVRKMRESDRPKPGPQPPTDEISGEDEHSAA